MKILFVDTTTQDLVVALIEENCVRTFGVEHCGTHHSEKLCGCVQDALDRCGLTFADVDAYACAIGPGSFTGIRIGISTMKGYALAVPKPFIAVNCLQAIACSERCGAKGSAVINAGNGYYFADYTNGVASCLIEYSDERAACASHTESAMGYLDGAVQIVRNKFVLGEFDEGLSPLYIRRSQAEENRK